MNIPSDWDEASPGNDLLCQSFLYDEYVGKCGRKMPFRYFIPEYQDSPVPLVLYLHGADAVGDDNERPLSIHDIGTVFSKDDWQKIHPCHILAPQYKRSMHWAKDDMPDYLQEFLASYIKRYKIDTSRIYIYGYSAGGIGTLRNIKCYPHFFAGAIVICGATTGKDFDLLKDTPMWLFHAVDDMIVPYSDHLYAAADAGYHGSRSIYDHLKDTMGDSIKYTEYERGYMKNKYHINPHCTWVPAAECKEAHEWLFEQKRNITM